MRAQKIFLVVFAIIIFIAIGGGIWIGKEEPLFIKLLLAFIFAIGPTIIFFIGLSKFRRERIRREPARARQIRRMRNGLGVLHIHLKAILYFYLLLFAISIPSLIAMGVSAGVTGQNFPPEEGIWWPPIISAIVALIVLGALYYFTRRRRFWAIFRDVFSKPTKVRGRVTDKRIETTSGMYTTTEHLIALSGDSRTFRVFGKIYDWLWGGDEVVVCCWPRSRTVAWVERVS